MKIATAVLAAALLATAASAAPATKERFFEKREYTVNPGKMEALHARFRDHTNRLFKKHGIEMVGYWVTASGDEAGQKLVFLLAYPSKEAREASWKAFASDPEWKKAKEDSEKDGVLVAKVDSTFLTPTDYSPMK